VGNGGDGHEEMKGNDGCSLETTAHLPYRIVLGNLQGLDEAFVLPLGGVEGEAVGEDRKDQSMEDSAPIGIVKPADGVAKDAQGTYRRPGSICHDGDVVAPVKTEVEENAKITNDLGPLDRKGPRGKVEAELRHRGADEIRGLAWGKGYEFSFVRIALEAVA